MMSTAGGVGGGEIETVVSPSGPFCAWATAPAEPSLASDWLHDDELVPEREIIPAKPFLRVYVSA